jgi:Leucine-rich repeat (LRR) protein
MGISVNEQTILRSVHNVSSSEAVAVCDLKGKGFSSLDLSKAATVQFPNLVRLDLSDNAIDSIENLKYLKQLKWLNLSNNRLESNGLEPLSRCCDTIRVLNVSGNRLSSFDGLEDAPLTRSLLALIASDNALTEECLNAVKNCTELNSLIVSNNSIESLKHELLTLRKLGKFSASNNGMEKIGNDSFSQNTDLRELRLAKNRLTELPSGLSKNINLRVLDCSHNRINNFAGVQVLAKLTKLTHLSLRGNPIAILDGKAYVDNVKAMCPRLRTLDGHPLDDNHPAMKGDDDNDNEDDGSDDGEKKNKNNINNNNNTENKTTPTFGLKRAIDDGDNETGKEDVNPPSKKKRGKRGKKKKEENKNEKSFLETLVNGEDIDGGGGNNHDSDEEGKEDDRNANGGGEHAASDDKKKKIIVLGKELEKQKPLSDKEFDEKLERDRLKRAGVVKVEDVKVHRHKNKIFGSEVFKKLTKGEETSAWDDEDDDEDEEEEMEKKKKKKKKDNDGGALSDKGVGDDGMDRDASDGKRIVKNVKPGKQAKKKKSTKDMTVEELKAYRKLQRKRGY